MMFLDAGADVLAISQPAHAWVSGQLLRHWADALPEPVLLAAEQHDLAWIDWERAPSFDPATGRPHLFRDVGASSHAPLWAEAVERAYAAWGTHVALLVSRHGSVIYTRFVDRHRAAAADAAAGTRYVAEQAPMQAAWAGSLGLDDATLERESELIALVDALSLGLCGGLELPLEVEGAGRYRLAHLGSGYTLDPWPFRGERVEIVAEARTIPGGRFVSEAAMRTWVASARSVPIRFMLRPA